MNGAIGQPLDRTDGPLKVCGQATYAAEFDLPRLAHAVMVQSTIAHGRIIAIDTEPALRMPGVLAVLTHENAERLPEHGRAAVDPPVGRVLSLLQDDAVAYNGQPIAVVVADSFEHAVAAAPLVEVEYAAEAAKLDFTPAQSPIYAPEEANRQPPDSSRGDVEAGWQAGAVRSQATYSTPKQHHNPIEPHATIAAWDGDRLTLYDSTQGISGVRKTVAKTFGMPQENVHVLSPYVGGGFGCKGSIWSHVILSAMAARAVGRPVKLSLTRTQMFGPVGGRPQTEQRIRLAAKSDGTLTALRHDTVSHTSFLEDYVEPSSLQSRMLYACPNAATSHRLLKLHVGTPTFQRAPGEATGTYAIEAALDELAYELGMDPLELRLRNYAETDPDTGRPFSSKSLRACYRTGAERFGWSRRNPEPRSMREGRQLIGWGMATATYPTRRSGASASASILPDGSAIVASGSQDIGTGTYTVMTQVAAETLGLPVDKVRFRLGDSALPSAPISGGSMTVASVAPSVQAACRSALDKLVAAATAGADSPLAGARREDVLAENGWLVLRSDRNRRESFAAAIARNGGNAIEAEAHVEPGKEQERYSMHAFGAVFAEVRVDEDLGVIRVPRVIGSYGVGRLMNAKTGRSQLMGGIVWGISLALLEETHVDARTGHVVNANLAEYHVPVNADIGEIDIIVVDEDDPYVNSLGAKGIGEIGITGVGAAVANAVYHATGRRVRDLPITLDKVLA